jgi:alpha-L-arabinofuranosidase
VLKLYRHHFGVVPVATEASRPLEAMAAWTADRKAITLGIVNASTEPAEIPLEVKGAKLAGTGTRWQIAGNDPMAYNDPSTPDRVRIESSPLQGVANKVSVAGCSVTLLVLDVQP